MNFNIKSRDELRKLFEELGYFPTNYMMSEAYLALQKLGGSVSTGQKTWSMCLDGPAGAGKSSFVETYKDVASYLSGEEIEFISFQCNDTVGKSDFYEEVGMVAVVIKDEKKIIIPGCVVKAIESVNKGKKVIFLLDELDKARPEADVFFYDFLQSGKINTTQLGDLSIKPEYMSNLQVFFCKNDMRELTPPLIRRSRSLKLDYMKPDLFYKIALNNLSSEENPEINVLINLISLMYEFSYENKEKFNRLPATNELLIAIEDAYLLSNGIMVPTNEIYELILNRIFKDEDDLDSFKGLVKATKKEKYNGLKNVLGTIESSEKEFKVTDLRESMAEEILESTLKSKVVEIDKLKNELEQKKQEAIKDIEEQKRLLLEERIKLRNGESTPESVNNIELNGGKLVLGENTDNVLSNFNDSTEFVLRGKNIFDVSKDSHFTRIASLSLSENVHNDIIGSFIKMAKKLGVVIYENGVLFVKSIVSLVMVCEKYDDKINYSFYSSNPIIPSDLFLVVADNYELLSLLVGTLNKAKDIINGISADALVYNDENLPFDEVSRDVYHINYESISLSDFIKNIRDLKLVCCDRSKALEAYIGLKDKNVKKLAL